MGEPNLPTSASAPIYADVIRHQGVAKGPCGGKPPDVLKAASDRGAHTASMAADVFSFGMCIVQAVSGNVPWGKATTDVEVSYHVRRGKLPNMPTVFTPSQWTLVKHMCTFDPQHRPDVGIVVKALGIIVSSQTIAPTVFK